LFFLYLNIVFNLSHASNHSQTSTNFTLNPLTFTFNPLQANKTSFTLWSTWIHLHPLPPINVEERGEGRGKFLYFLIIFVMQWFEGDIKITIRSAILFSA